MLAYTYTLSIILMISVPVILAVVLRRYFQVPWLLFGIGTLTFIGSQVVHIPLNNLLVDLGVLPQNAKEGWDLTRMVGILGLTAGLCEELARAAGYALLRKFRRLEDGLMLGIGHGGVESMVLGGVLTAATISSLMMLRGQNLQELGLNADQMETLTLQMELFTRSAWSGFAPFFERLLAMTLHVILSVLVWKAFSERNAWYVVFAIVYHALVDAFGVFVAVRTSNLWLIEAVFLAFVLPGLVWLGLQFRREKPAQRAAHPGSEGRLFLVALGKELLALWRTKRFLITIAVFGLFGLVSPLLAYFMPEILGSVEGAEMFADLIPEPTVYDAVTQYIKNITQFGFLIAILLGMGAVSGEKERGTAELILSKPLPRWAFVLSKFTAQVISYFAAFAAAASGGYLYIRILFGEVSLGGFVAVNLLLLLWLLTFAAITLLASVVGSSIGAAAGMALGGSVLVMLAGSLPRFGALFPGGLVAWAGQMISGSGADQTGPNFGAVAAGLVIIVLCNIWAVGFFERQEL